MVITCKCGDESTFFSSAEVDFNIESEATDGKIELVNETKVEFTNSNDTVVVSMNTSTQQVLIPNKIFPKVSINNFSSNANVLYTTSHVINAIGNRNCAGTNRIDQLPSATALVDAIPNCQVDTTFSFMLRNTGTNNTLTLDVSAGGITLNGVTSIAHNSSAQWLFTVTDVDTPIIVGYLVNTQVLTVAPAGWTNTHSVKITNNNQSVLLSPPASFALNRTANNSGQKWSMSFWYKATTSNAQVITCNNGLDVLIIGRDSNGKLTLQLGNLIGAQVNFNTDSNVLSNGVWKNVLITFNGGTTSGNIGTVLANFKVYIDGVSESLSGSLTSGGYTPAIAWTSVNIGTHNGAYYDEVAFFNEDVHSIVADIYNSGTPRDLDTLSGFSPQAWLQFTQTDIDNFPTIKDYGSLATDWAAQSMSTANILTDLP